MGTFDKLEIGRRSLFAAQSGQRTTGHNVANVNTEGYKKQTVHQSSAGMLDKGQLYGVNVDGIKQSTNEFLERKVLSSNSEFNNESTRSDILRKLEVIFNETTGKGVNNALTEFWGSWREVAGDSESMPLRQQLVRKSMDMAEKFTTLNADVKEARMSLVQELENEIKDVNAWADQIAVLNEKITVIDARKGNTNDLRDERDRLAEKISEKIDVQRTFNRDGKMHLEIGNGHTLVDNNSAFQLKYDFDSSQKDKAVLFLNLQDASRIEMNDFINKGTTREKLRFINEYIPEVMQKLDGIVNGVRDKTNEIYSVGTPLEGAFDKLVSAQPIPTEYFDAAIPGLKDGFVEFKVLNETGDIADTVKVMVKAEDTVDEIAVKINNAAGITSDNNEQYLNSPLSAGIVEGRMQVNARNGNRFYISHDDTGAMAKLGLNVFFTGHLGADDIKISENVLRDPMLINVGKDMLPGDNSVAAVISDQQFATPMNNGTESFEEHYDKVTAKLGLDLQTSYRMRDSFKETLDQFSAMRDEVTDVSLDEEMANMIRYQRAYEASAKFTTVADQMTQTLIDM